MTPLYNFNCVIISLKKAKAEFLKSFRIYQTLRQSTTYQRRNVLHLKFTHQVITVKLYGTRTNSQSVSQMFGGLSLHHVIQHLFFTISQQVSGIRFKMSIKFFQQSFGFSFIVQHHRTSLDPSVLSLDGND